MSAVAAKASCVGWVERSETHQGAAIGGLRRTDLGLARDRHQNMRRSGKPGLRAPNPPCETPYAGRGEGAASP